MWTTSRLTEEQYLDFFEVFTKNTDQYDRATESIVRFLATKNKPFKWLMIGPGLGNWESDIIQRSGASPAAVEVFEPNKATFRRLKKNLEDGIWSPVDCNNVELRNEPFSPSSVVHNDSFDLITISHVLYYVENVEERKAIYEKFADLLAENGAAFILQVSEDDADNLSGQSRLMMDVTRKILIKEDTCLVSPGDFTVTADLIHQEITSLECKNIKVEYIGPYWFKIMMPNNEIDWIKMISFLLGCQYEELPNDAKSFIQGWVKKNAEFVLNQKEGLVIMKKF